jgi:hypothetical protein
MFVWPHRYARRYHGLFSPVGCPTAAIYAGARTATTAHPTVSRRNLRRVTGRSCSLTFASDSSATPSLCQAAHQEAAHEGMDEGSPGVFRSRNACIDSQVRSASPYRRSLGGDGEPVRVGEAGHDRK